MGKGLKGKSEGGTWTYLVICIGQSGCMIQSMVSDETRLY